MGTSSQPINLAIDKAAASGNNVVEIVEGWSEMKEVVYMKRPLTGQLRADIKTINSLEYFFYKGSPHNPAEEYFIDIDKKITISFPAGKQV